MRSFSLILVLVASTFVFGCASNEAPATMVATDCADKTAQKATVDPVILAGDDVKTIEDLIAEGQYINPDNDLLISKNIPRPLTMRVDDLELVQVEDFNGDGSPVQEAALYHALGNRHFASSHEVVLWGTVNPNAQRGRRIRSMKGTPVPGPNNSTTIVTLVLSGDENVRKVWAHVSPNTFADPGEFVLVHKFAAN